MKPIVLSTFFAAPIAQVFDVYTDISKAVERIDGIFSLEVLTDGLEQPLRSAFHVAATATQARPGFPTRASPSIG